MREFCCCSDPDAGRCWWAAHFAPFWRALRFKCGCACHPR